MIEKLQDEKFAMEQVLLRDLSFETSGKHEGLKLEIEEVSISHDVGVKMLSGDVEGDSRHEVMLRLLVELIQEGSPRFLVEVEHVVMVDMHCPDPTVRERILQSHVPVHIQPYSLQVANSLLNQAGVPSLRLNPYGPISQNVG